MYDPINRKIILKPYVGFLFLSILSHIANKLLLRIFMGVVKGVADMFSTAYPPYLQY